MNLTTVILAAGHGKRMKTTCPKISHTLGGKPLLQHVIDLALTLDSQKIIPVISPDFQQKDNFSHEKVTFAVQKVAKGTGDAVKSALDHIGDNESVLILLGDVPLLTIETVQKFLQKFTLLPHDIHVMSFSPYYANAYGRLITEDDCVLEIKEFADANEEERKLRLCNSGIFALKGALLKELIKNLQPDNNQSEYYLTDIVKMAKDKGISTRHMCVDANEVKGINTLVDLAKAENIWQNRERAKHMLQGVKLIDPKTVTFHYDTIIESDVVIEPHVIFGPNVVVKKEAAIYGFCHLSDVSVGVKAKVGPFARIRGGAKLEEEAEVGNFVEVKKSHFGVRAKAKHLSYLGDCILEEKVNVGAGTITCNYDGVKKSTTHLKKGAFIGSNTSLVAPVVIGEAALVGAGSVITKDVPDGMLALGRCHQVIKTRKIKE